MAKGKVGRARRYAKKTLKFLKRHPEGKKKWGEIHSAIVAYARAVRKQKKNQKRTRTIYKKVKKGDKVTRKVVRVEQRKGHTPVKRKVIINL